MTVTIESMNQLCEKIAALRTEIDAFSKQKKQVELDCESAESELLACLTDAGMTNYVSPVGRFMLSFRMSVKTPKTDEDRAAFFAYLKNEGVFEQMITVNSQTLNAFYKSKVAEAQASGRDDLRIPGINEVKNDPVISFRRT
jgi:hypothetical protein